MSNIPLDTELYEKVKKMADKRFESKTGVYKSSWIVREYKRLGGKYSTSKPSEKTGLKRWYKENWVDLNRPIKKNGKVVGYEQCGRISILKKPGNKYPLCRPTKRVTFKTPKTISEISEESIKKAKREKQKIKSLGNIKFGGATDDKRKKSEATDDKTQKSGDISEEAREKLKKFLEKKRERVDKQPAKKIKKRKKKVIKTVEEILKEIETREKVFKKKIYHPYEKTYLQLSPEMSQKEFLESQARIREILPSKYSWMKQQNEKQNEKQNEQQEGGRAQYYGKKSSVMIDVPKNVKRWAEYAFKLRNQGFLGAIETGWKRAKQLSTQKSIPIEDLRYMRNWYARHIYVSYPSFKAWVDSGKPNSPEWHKKHGIISWLTWGGNAGFNWVNSDKVIKLLNNHFDKNYKKITKK